MNPNKFHAPWHPLKHVILGASYGPEFYEPIKDSCVRDSLQKIAQETEEDYLNIEKVLKTFDVQVDRPEIDQSNTIMDYVDLDGRLTYNGSQSYTLIPRPPMQPRDSLLVVGEQVLITRQEASWFVKDLGDNCQYSTLEFDAPMVTVVGDAIVVDCKEQPWLYQYFVKKFPDYRIVPAAIGGHNDAVYCLPKPGIIVSTHHHSNYEDTFPGWTVKFIENQSWNAIPNWRKLKHSNQGRWWSPESEQNKEFSNFVNTWLTHWLGYVEETVFDVNMLQINEKTILVNNYNKEMFEFFKQHNIEPIITPFRHRFFWDGGIHCITNDLYREGVKEKYVKF
jgi:hypothetical protein